MKRAAALLLALTACIQQAPAPTLATQPPPAAPTAPAAQPMDATMALGLWSSSFGPVKIEADETGPSGAVIGVWTYDKDGQPVTGYFQGSLDGNLLRYTWHEPAQPYDLKGEGYLSFTPDGSHFEGRWWTTLQDRTGDWTADRSAKSPAPPSTAPSPDGPTDDRQPRPQGDAEQAPPGGPPATI
jgi:hypothetical protein